MNIIFNRENEVLFVSNDIPNEFINNDDVVICRLEEGETYDSSFNYVIKDEVAVKGDAIVINPDEVTAMEQEAQATQYVYERANSYPPVGEQLDALFHAGVFPQEMADKLQAVKDAHPKPTGE